MKKSKLISIFIFWGIFISYGEAKEAVGEFKLSFSVGTESKLNLRKPKRHLGKHISAKSQNRQE